MMDTRNYALKRPASQSSLAAGWSRGKTVTEEARGANNGNLSVDYGCHTRFERNPWWQVDLGSEIAIQRVVIFNRQDCAYRLQYFSLYGSLDGKTWHRFFKKTDNFVFGREDNAPYTVEPVQLVLARYVRLQLDCHEVLHFREIEIYGKLATETDRAIQKSNEDLAATQRILLAGDREGAFTRLSGHIVFVDTRNYGRTIVSALKQGTYEQTERRLVEALLHPSDRVLEVGTAIGVVTMVAAAITAPEQVLTFDGNPHIVADAKKNFVANGMADINSNTGILKCRKNYLRSGHLEKFHVSKNFWASRFNAQEPGKDIIEVVDVPVFCLEDQIKAHAANVLIVDIEGGEVDLLQGAKIPEIRLIIVEVHYWAVGQEKTDAMIRYLMKIGFNIDLKFTAGGVVVLRRGSTPGPQTETKPKEFWRRLPWLKP